MTAIRIDEGVMTQLRSRLVEDPETGCLEWQAGHVTSRGCGQGRSHVNTGMRPIDGGRIER